MSMAVSGVAIRVLNDRPDARSLVAFYAAFLLAAGIGQWLAGIPGIAIIVWPPNGVYIAALLLSRRQTWPWWVGVALLAELTSNAIWFHNPIHLAVAYNAANALEALAAAWLLGRFFPRPARLHTLNQVIAFTLIGVVFAPMIAATIGCTIDAWIGKHDFATAWPLWWIGDATGVLIAAPLVLVFVQIWHGESALLRQHAVEAVALLVALFGLAALAVETNLPFYIVMPPLLWAAIRFEFKGAAVTSFLLTLMVALFTLADLSQFAQQGASDMQKHVSMQLFLALSALTGLVVAAISRQRRMALFRLSAANEDLEARVAERTAALQESEARFRNMADHAPVMVWVTDLEGKCVFLSKSWYKFTGQTEETGLGLGWLEAVHSDDRAQMEREFLEANAARAAFRLEYRLRQDNGEWCWVIDAAQPRFDDQGHFLGHIGSVLDISERKQAEEEKHLLMREVNHRSKNLLSLVQAVARQTAAATPEDFLRRFSERLSAISSNQDLLVRSEWKPVSLEELVRLQLAHLLDHANERIILSGPAITVSAAASQTLGIALHELGTNAAKYGSLASPSGRVDIIWSIARNGADEGRFIMSWTESGGPEVRAPTRTGFGSKVISDMVRRAFSADVHLDYAPHGLSWRIECAVSSVLDTPSRAASPASIKPGARTPGKRSVLVVEDEPLISMELTATLQNAGFAIIGPAAKVSDALALIEGTGCDLAVLDINLGHETTELIAEHLRKTGIPFVTVSGYALDQVPAIFHTQPLLSKPVRAEVLVRTVTRCLEGPESHRYATGG
jgi:PAS domain S-box-containing protein